ncbi:MAG: hypothetical protein J0L92_21680 [Deltaproteobacteria bacterium]|nr:hypothetical protein [Deltaproteobacteria bacterium]
MTRGSFGCAIALGLGVAALGVPGCACDGPSVSEDASIDPSIDARGPDAWARPDADRGDAGPDAYDPLEDPCVTSPRSVDCARELLREIDAETCDAERACGRPITDEGCEAYFPSEGADLVRASEDELTLIRLGVLEIVPETLACLRERMRTCSEEDPNTCGPLFRPRVPPVEDRPCRLDAECGERLRCEGEEVGPRGMPVGEELCRVGRCVPRTADGEACELELGIDDPIGPCLRASVCLEGVCASVVRSEAAAFDTPCGYVADGADVVFRSCGAGQCLAQPDGIDRCVPVPAIGEACTDYMWCGRDAACADGRCVALPVFGDPCAPSSEGSWCAPEAFGTACIDGICVPNPRRLGETCAPQERQPCSEGICAEDTEDPGTMRCQESLRSRGGQRCRRTDADCLDGVCCAGTCVSLGGPVITSLDD